jgi:hypothetical protein
MIKKLLRKKSRICRSSHLIRIFNLDEGYPLELNKTLPRDIASDIIRLDASLQGHKRV